MRPVYYASGSNTAACIRGFDSVGHPIGVAAPEVSPASEAALLETRVPVFVDSGAFSEVVFEATGVRVVKPITDADWRERLALYRRLAVGLGSRVSLVAPDRIADQDETLRRLTTYAPELRELRALGARLLVPVQKGSRSQACFVREVIAVLGFDDFVHAIPSKKRATSMEELAAYVREVKPHAVHLLGLGLRSPNAPVALGILSDTAEVSLDSCLITAMVGRNPPRPLTIALAHARQLLVGSSRSTQELAIRLCFGHGVGFDRAAAREGTLTRDRTVTLPLPEIGPCCGSRRCYEERLSGLPGCENRVRMIAAAKAGTVAGPEVHVDEVASEAA